MKLLLICWFIVLALCFQGVIYNLYLRGMLPSIASKERYHIIHLGKGPDVYGTENEAHIYRISESVSFYALVFGATGMCVFVASGGIRRLRQR